MFKIIQHNTGIDVFTLEDPCDPCYNNPYVRGDMSCLQKGARAARSFAKGDLVGMYVGRLVTKVRKGVAFGILAFAAFCLLSARLAALTCRGKGLCRSSHGEQPVATSGLVVTLDSEGPPLPQMP